MKHIDTSSSCFFELNYRTSKSPLSHSDSILFPCHPCPKPHAPCHHPLTRTRTPWPQTTATQKSRDYPTSLHPRNSKLLLTFHPTPSCSCPPCHPPVYTPTTVSSQTSGHGTGTSTVSPFLTNPESRIAPRRGARKVAYSTSVFVVLARACTLTGFGGGTYA